MLAAIAFDARGNDVVDRPRAAPTYWCTVVSLQSVRTKTAIAASGLIDFNQAEPFGSAETAGNGTSTLIAGTLVGASLGRVCRAPSLPVIKLSARVPSVSPASPRGEGLLVLRSTSSLRRNQSIVIAPVIVTVVGALLLAIRRIGAVSLDSTRVGCAFGLGSHLLANSPVAVAKGHDRTDVRPRQALGHSGPINSSLIQESRGGETARRRFESSQVSRPHVHASIEKVFGRPSVWTAVSADRDRVRDC